MASAARVPRRVPLFLAAAASLSLAAGSQAASHYTISGKDSRFTYSMEHPMHNWSGTSQQARGAVAIDLDGKTAQVEVTIPVLSFDSGNSNRDSHMAEVVESYIYSDVGFKSTQAQLDSLETTPGGRTRTVWSVRGNLDLHGVSRELACPVQVTVTADSMAAHGSFAVKLTDFGLELPSLVGLKCKDEIQMVFDVAAARDGEPAGKATQP